MPSIDVKVDPELVNAYLQQHGLEEGFVEIETLLLQGDGMASGAPAVMLVVKVDGKRVVAKLSWTLWQMATGAIVGALQRQGRWP